MNFRVSTAAKNSPYVKLSDYLEFTANNINKGILGAIDIVPWPDTNSFSTRTFVSACFLLEAVLGRGGCIRFTRNRVHPGLHLIQDSC